MMDGRVNAQEAWWVMDGQSSGEIWVSTDRQGELAVPEQGHSLVFMSISRGNSSPRLKGEVEVLVARRAVCVKHLVVSFPFPRFAVRWGCHLLSYALLIMMLSC
jgi:hypothetical protein